MANLKEVRNRISSTISTQQITKAMKLVSATKLRKAQQAITQIRPYSDKLSNVLGNLAQTSKDESELAAYFESSCKEEKVLVLVLSSDRGLCGAFNSNVIKEVKWVLKNKVATPKNAILKFIGKKAHEALRAEEGLTFNTSHMSLLQNLKYEEVFNLGQEIIDDFLNGTYSEVFVVYNKFKNAATQFKTVEKILPIAMENFEVNESEKDSKYLADFRFEPSKLDLLMELIPRVLKTQIYRAILDSVASEHGSRMVTMDKATENAGEILKNLKLEYNQARQAAITKEILEIVGGAAALEG
jgi:F-type H+-transporting ATPase subunit gamma